MTQPTTNKTNAVETIEDLLSQSQDSDWTDAKPDRIGYLWDFDQQDRTSYPNTALYVWSPTSGTITKFSADGNHMLEDFTIEILVMSLDPLEARQYARDTVQYLSQYYNAGDETDFYTIAPSELADIRNEKIPRQTDHYLFSVQVDPQRLKQTG
jgi:hypothetical protein